MQTKFLKNDEYPPSEDTFFITKNIENEKGNFALDVGSGSGYLTKLLSENFDFVVGTDINFDVLKNQTYKTKNLVCCNGSDALKIKFDFIVCNLPYLATDGIIDIATDGVRTGLEIIKRFMENVENYFTTTGKVYLLISSLIDKEKMHQIFSKSNLKYKIESKKRYDDEFLYAYCLKRKSL